MITAFAFVAGVVSTLAALWLMGLILWGLVRTWF